VALRLAIISEAEGTLGEPASALFGTAGGTIGRSHDNDWVLPDPDRYLSSHHARIRYRNGGYIIEDTSTNGLFLNDGVDPVGRLGPQPLRHGDTLRLGPYKIKVTDDAASMDASSVVPFATTPGDSTAHQHDIGVELDISDLLVTNPDVSAERQSYDPWGQRIEESALLQFDTSMSAARTLRPTALPLRAPAPGPGVGSAPTAGLETWCRGAGLDPHKLPFQSQERLLRLSGLLLREAMVGIKNLAKSQREARLAAGLPALLEDPERLALQGQPVEDLLVRLLVGHDAQQLDAVQWLREVFGLASRHDSALLRALRPALEQFTQRLDPALLGKDSGSAERFRSITGGEKDQLPQLFAESLARCLETEIKRGSEKD
jgi:type VI secretion system protein